MFANPGDRERPKMRADRDLLEQVVYNLVGNAVKYCHRGTTVWLDCKRVTEEGRRVHILTVTDFGPKVEGGDEIYKLYHRGKNVSEGEGMGVGLFVAQRIAEAHGGSIQHRSTPVSDYSVALIEHYIKAERTRSFVPDNMLKKQLEAELARLKRNGIYKKIVARSKQWGLLDYQPAKRQLTDAIRESTYEVVFEVMIP